MTAHDNAEPKTTENFETLLKEAGEGSEAAVWRLLDVYGPHLARAINRRFPEALRAKLDPADIAQSVWISLLRHPSRMAKISSPEQLLAYLAGMARWKTIDVHRTFTESQNRDVRREQSLDELLQNTDNGPLTDNPIASRNMSPSSITSMRERWDRAIAATGPRGAEVLKLRLCGRSQDEIAAELSVSTATVRRTMRSLRESLQL